MGVKPGGNIALLACAGPMGIGAIDYAINGGIQPSRVVVVDIDDKRLAQVQKLLPVELAASKGIELVYMNTKGMSDRSMKMASLSASTFPYSDSPFPHSFIKRIWRHTLLATFMVVTMN